MDEAIDLARQKILPFRVNRGQVIDFSITANNADGTPYDFTGHTAEMYVYNSFAKTDTPEYTIEVVLSSGTIAFSHEAITRRREDFVYQLWITNSSGYRQPWINGPFLVLNREWDHEDGEDTIVISLNGDNVTLTITPLSGGGGGSGDVVGPASSVDNNIATFSGLTGKVIQDSGKAFSIDGTLASNSDNKIPTEKAVKTYADALVTGLWDDRGTFDASGGAYPNSGGSGTAGAILKGDIWTISVAGTLPTGQVVEIGDTVRALIDTPGNTQANWAIGQNNIGYVPVPNTRTINGHALSSDITLAQTLNDVGAICDLAVYVRESSLSITNQPTTEQDLGVNTRFRKRFDATNYSYARVCADIQSVSTSANNPRLYPSYSIDSGANWITIGTGLTNERIDLTSLTNQATAWIALPEGAKGNFMFRVSMNGGDSAGDPILGNVHLQFKT